jgi:NADPH:quinone reductase-like Zn-dependent oxidoreductase
LKAIVQRRYGSPDWLELRDVAKPVVGETDVLVRVHAASVNAADWHFLTGTPYVLRLASGILRPRRTIPGRDLAGRVEAVGGSVTRFRVGDEVFGTPGDELRNIVGTFAEYVVAPETRIAPKPVNLTFEQAAAAPQAGVTAFQALRKGNVQPGMTVLINGAGGGVGTFAVQIAKALGAEVTDVCSSHSVELVTSLGADHVIDYTREDFTNTGGRWFGPIGRIIKAAAWSPFIAQTLATLVAVQAPEDLISLKELLGTGQITPVIGRRFRLSEASDALRHHGEGHSQGKTVITLVPDAPEAT